MPQIHILLILWVLNVNITFNLNPALFVTTFATSVLSATLGIAKFLKTGPCRLVPDQGPLGGHGTLAFFLLMLNIASTTVSKGLMLPAIAYNIKYNGVSLFYGYPDGALKAIALWLAICYSPQILYVRFSIMKLLK